MKNVIINGHPLRFDWGTMEHIGFATGLDAANPLEGVPVAEQAVAMLYGGLARLDERDDKPISHSLNQCRKIIRDFSGAQIKRLIDAYNISMTIDEDEASQSAKKDEEDIVVKK